ncbi:hypothetical protein [Martelella lutilitoris]|nr:hypothetical protein [Martelella lutilitoris]
MKITNQFDRRDDRAFEAASQQSAVADHPGARRVQGPYTGIAA